MPKACRLIAESQGKPRRRAGKPPPRSVACRNAETQQAGCAVGKGAGAAEVDRLIRWLVGQREALAKQVGTSVPAGPCLATVESEGQ